MRLHKLSFYLCFFLSTVINRLLLNYLKVVLKRMVRKRLCIASIMSKLFNALSPEMLSWAILSLHNIPLLALHIYVHILYFSRNPLEFMSRLLVSTNQKAKNVVSQHCNLRERFSCFAVIYLSNGHTINLKIAIFYDFLCSITIKGS